MTGVSRGSLMMRSGGCGYSHVVAQLLNSSPHSRLVSVILEVICILRGNLIVDLGGLLGGVALPDGEISLLSDCDQTPRQDADDCRSRHASDEDDGDEVERAALPHSCPTALLPLILLM